MLGGDGLEPAGRVGGMDRADQAAGPPMRRVVRSRRGTSSRTVERRSGGSRFERRRAIGQGGTPRAGAESAQASEQGGISSTRVGIHHGRGVHSLVQAANRAAGRSISLKAGVLRENRIIVGAFGVSVLLHLVLALVTWRIPFVPQVDPALADDRYREVEVLLAEPESAADAAAAEPDLPTAITSIPDRQASDTPPPRADFLAEHDAMAADRSGGSSDKPRGGRGRALPPGGHPAGPAGRGRGRGLQPGAAAGRPGSHRQPRRGAGGPGRPSRGSRPAEGRSGRLGAAARAERGRRRVQGRRGRPADGSAEAARSGEVVGRTGALDAQGGAAELGRGPRLRVRPEVHGRPGRGRGHRRRLQPQHLRVGLRALDASASPTSCTGTGSRPTPTGWASSAA